MKAWEIVARVGNAELLCTGCGSEDMDPVFAVDEMECRESCGACREPLRDDCGACPRCTPEGRTECPECYIDDPALREDNGRTGSRLSYCCKAITGDNGEACGTHWDAFPGA